MQKRVYYNNFNLFLLIFIISIIQVLFTKYFLELDELIFDFYSSKLAEEQIDRMIITQEKWEWLSYAIIPIVILLRISLVALCLNVGMFFYNVEHTIKFKHFFRIALLGEFVLVLLGFFKLGYFYFIKTDYTLLDIQQYYPLSYINFLDLERIEPWLIYPLQTINLFEIAYFFVLVYGLWKLLKNKYSKSIEIVAVSYGGGLLIWLGLVMFLMLNIS